MHVNLYMCVCLIFVVHSNAFKVFGICCDDQKFSLILNQMDLWMDMYVCDATQPIHNIIFELYNTPSYTTYLPLYYYYVVYMTVFYGIELMFVESVMQIVVLFMQQTALLPRLENILWFACFPKCVCTYIYPVPIFLMAAYIHIPLPVTTLLLCYVSRENQPRENGNANHFPQSENRS